MHSPPFIKVAEEAITPLTVIYCFLSTFFNADFVKTELKIPTPYSWSRIGEGILGTICISVGLIMFLMSCPEIWLQVKIDFTLILNIPYLVFYSLKINVILFHCII